jgi:hypothetical protein
MEDARHYLGVHKKKAKIAIWEAALTVEGEKQYLGTWRDLEHRAHDYDWMVIHHVGKRARLNFPPDRGVVEPIGPSDIDLPRGVRRRSTVGLRRCSGRATRPRRSRRTPW